MEILGQAWNISPQGINTITENGSIKDKSTILKNALNSDLKEIGSPVLVNKGHLSDVVLQIQKIRNISAPKANENSQAAPRMLKLVLTDGDTYIQAIETSLIPSINRNTTPPGTKLLIKSAKISSNFLLLDSNNCSLLGGRVPALYEKWELAKSVQHYNRQNSSSDGPPAWVNFGCRMAATEAQDKSFKSLGNKDKEGKENSEFELLRQGAIAEATAGAVRKVFGGGAKQSVQPVATYKRTEPPRREKRNQRNGKFSTKEMEEKIEKPSDKVSLFAFLEDKLPTNQNNDKYPRNYVNNQVGTETRVNHFDRQGNNTTRTNQHYQHNHRNNTNFKPQHQQSYESNSKQNSEVNDLSNQFGRASLNSNSQFASRSLRQHLNLGQQKNKNDNSSNGWKVGDECMAKYWEDGKLYKASITAITDNTCVVKFRGYDNIEEVLKSDCLPVSREESFRRMHAGSMEFRRSAKQQFKKQ